MNWFIKIIAAILAFFLYIPTGEIEYYSFLQENPELVFSILSDVHIEGNDEEKIQLFGDALCDINCTSGRKNDALIFLGDNTMNNQVVELSIFYGFLKEYCEIPNILMITGNHDLCPSDYNVGNYEDLRERFFDYKNEYIKAQYDDSVYYSYEIKGYKFIVLGSESDAGIQEDLSDEQLEWLENQLKEAKGTDKPIFILNHYPLNHTWADVWQEGHIGEDNDKLYKILTNAQNQILYFSGHLHMGLYNDHREVIYEDNITFINVPSFGSENTDGDADIQDTGMGHLVEVYENEIVIRVRNFAEHKWIDVEYKVDIK